MHGVPGSTGTCAHLGTPHELNVSSETAWPCRRTHLALFGITYGRCRWTATARVARAAHLAKLLQFACQPRRSAARTCKGGAIHCSAAAVYGRIRRQPATSSSPCTAQGRCRGTCGSPQRRCSFGRQRCPCSMAAGGGSAAGRSQQSCIMRRLDQARLPCAQPLSTAMRTTGERPHPADASTAPAFLRGADAGGRARIPNLADGLHPREASSTWVPAPLVRPPGTKCWQPACNLHEKLRALGGPTGLTGPIVPLGPPQQIPCTCHLYTGRCTCSQHSRRQWRVGPECSGQGAQPTV